MSDPGRVIAVLVMLVLAVLLVVVSPWPTGKGTTDWGTLADHPSVTGAKKEEEKARKAREKAAAKEAKEAEKARKAAEKKGGGEASEQGEVMAKNQRLPPSQARSERGRLRSDLRPATARD